MPPLNVFGHFVIIGNFWLLAFWGLFPTHQSRRAPPPSPTLTHAPRTRRASHTRTMADDSAPTDAEKLPVTVSEWRTRDAFTPHLFPLFPRKKLSLFFFLLFLILAAPLRAPAAGRGAETNSQQIRGDGCIFRRVRDLFRSRVLIPQPQG